MSTTTTVTVHCDLCSQWTDGGCHSQTVMEARGAARRAGWLYRKGPQGMVDVCLDCKPTAPGGRTAWTP